MKISPFEPAAYVPASPVESYVYRALRAMAEHCLSMTSCDKEDEEGWIAALRDGIEAGLATLEEPIERPRRSATPSDSWRSWRSMEDGA